MIISIGWRMIHVSYTIAIRSCGRGTDVRVFCIGDKLFHDLLRHCVLPFLLFDIANLEEPWTQHSNICISSEDIEHMLRKSNPLSADPREFSKPNQWSSHLKLQSAQNHCLSSFF